MIHDAEAARVRIFLLYRTEDAMFCFSANSLLFRNRYTRFVSREASLSTGTMIKKKNIDRIANPLAARAYKIMNQLSSLQYYFQKPLTTTPWSQANMASSYSRVTRSHLAVM